MTDAIDDHNGHDLLVFYYVR